MAISRIRRFSSAPFLNAASRCAKEKTVTTSCAVPHCSRGEIADGMGQAKEEARITMERIPRSTADEFCQKIKPQAKPIYVRDSQVKGLVLRVMPTGSKSWIFCYTAPCPKRKWRERRKGLGPFRCGRNDTGGVSVPAARREAEPMQNEERFEGAETIQGKRK